MHTPLDNVFAYQVSQKIMDDIPDPKTIQQAMQLVDWPQWEAAINSELDSLISRKVFGPIKPVPYDTHLTGYRWIFVKKRNAAGEVVRHKACLVARGFTQILGRDYEETYSPVMDVITYRYLIAFAQQHQLCMHQMDIVTAYLYGTLDKTIYMQAPPELVQRINYHSKAKAYKIIRRKALQAIRRDLCYT
jgi:hypothetical protein